MPFENNKCSCEVGLEIKKTMHEQPSLYSYIQGLHFIQHHHYTLYATRTHVQTFQQDMDIAIRMKYAIRYDKHKTVILEINIGHSVLNIVR